MQYSLLELSLITSHYVRTCLVYSHQTSLYLAILESMCLAVLLFWRYVLVYLLVYVLVY